MPTRRASIVMWSLFGAFLVAVVLASLAATRVTCEVCVAEDERSACAPGAGADREEAVTAAQTVACDRLHGERSATGGPRVRPQVDEAAACVRAEPESVECREP